MIIFDLDGTLADCAHRRHLVDLSQFGESQMGFEYADGRKWKPDWRAFYEACEEDTPIKPVIHIFDTLWTTGDVYIQIWSGRCESVRKKTEEWLYKNLGVFMALPRLKMRPIGDSTPDDQLYFNWTNNQLILNGGKIDMVFSAHKPTIEMFRRRAIFTFDVG